MSPSEKDLLSHAMSMLARRSAAKMTKKQRQERARKGALARWGKKKPPGA